MLGIIQILLLSTIVTHTLQAQVTEEWSKRYNNVSKQDDVANALTVDGKGNVYITGFTRNGIAFATVKYDAQGNQQWAKTYSPGQGIDIAVDTSGNVYVTGIGQGNFITLKYDGQGNLLWVKTYDSSTATDNLVDTPAGLALDAQGNVYVIGVSGSPDISSYNEEGYPAGIGNFTTIKYDPQGNQLWRKVRVFKDQYDLPIAMAVKDMVMDGAGNVFITGIDVWNEERFGTTIGFTVKYNAQGSEQWTKNISGEALAVNGQGQLYIATDQEGANNSLIKLDVQGKQLWQKSETSPASADDKPVALAIDVQGNVYISSCNEPSLEAAYTTIKYDGAGNKLWMKQYNDAANWEIHLRIHATDLSTDAQGNAYLSGGASGEYFTLKYDGQGNQVWLKRYSWPVGDFFRSNDVVHTQVDAQGNLYVARTKGISPAYAIIKYTSSGTELWLKEYNTPFFEGNDRAVAIAKDAQGNVYVGGISGIRNFDSDDLLLIKYDPQGNQVWVRTYNGPANGQEELRKMIVDSLGNIYMAGTSEGNGQPGEQADYLVLKYNSQGDQLWVKRFEGPVANSPEDTTSNSSDRLADMEVDAAGNVYVTGNSYYSNSAASVVVSDMVTIKYNAQGGQEWIQSYNGLGNGSDEPTDLLLDTQGNLYITGRSDDHAGVDKFVAIKYDAQGKLLWAKRHDTVDKGDDWPMAIQVDAQGNVYVTGFMSSDTGKEDFLTVKYNAQGSELWARSFNGKGNHNDAARGIVVDAQGNVYVTGASNSGQDDPNQQYDIATVAYDAQGNQLWATYYNSEEDGQDFATGILFDQDENLLVRGYSTVDNITTPFTIYYNKQGKEISVHIMASFYPNSSILFDEENQAIYTTGNIEIGTIPSDIVTIKYKKESTPICSASGSILQEVWLNVAGSLVSDIPVNSSPSTSNFLTSFEAPTNAGTNYGQRLRGYLCVPQNGNYTFYISGDDRCELWLSTDDDPAKKVKIASVPYYTGVREWNKYPSQKSVSIALVSSKKYYIEALHKEGPYADHLAVGWQKSDSTAITVIEGGYLSPYVPQGEGTITRQYWANVTGSLVSDIPLATPPAFTDELTSFETATNAGTNYGQRLRGYVHPPVSGSYTFFIAGDDRCELYLSIYDDPEKKTLIAYAPYFTASRQWHKYDFQQSYTMYLVAGRKYYIEALHKEGPYADHLAVAWETPQLPTPVVIEGKYLSPYQVSDPIARLAVSKNTEPTSVKVFPNPFDRKLTVSSSYEGTCYITLLDNLGRTLYQTTKSLNGVEMELTLPDLSAGVYFVKLTEENGTTQVIQVVKK